MFIRRSVSVRGGWGLCGVDILWRSNLRLVDVHGVIYSFANDCDILAVFGHGCDAIGSLRLRCELIIFFSCGLPFPDE